jgi:hypothetical protein
MKRDQWTVQRTVRETADAQKRWDQAYLLVLEIARSVEQKKIQTEIEVQHASSDLRPGVDPAAGPGTNH